MWTSTWRMLWLKGLKKVWDREFGHVGISVGNERGWNRNFGCIWDDTRDNIIVSCLKRGVVGLHMDRRSTLIR